MDLRRYLTLAKTWAPLAVASFLLAAIVAYAVSSLQEKVYEARTTLIVGQSLSGISPDYSQLLASQRLSATYAAVVTTRPLAEGVIEELTLDESPGDLLERVVSEAPTDSTLVYISAQDADPDLAAAIANAFAEQLIAASPAIQGRQAELQASIDADLEATQAQITSTQARIEELTRQAERTPEEEAELATLEARLVSLRSSYSTLLTFSSANAANLVSIVEPAASPEAPIAPRPLLNAVIAAVLGLLVAVGIAWVVDRLRDPIEDPDAILEATDLSTLGTISRMRGDGSRKAIYQLAALMYPRSGVTEAYRTLRTNIDFAAVDAPIRSLLVTSSVPGEGKTVTSANLAAVFAQAGRRVLLVDADLRRPGSHLMFGLPNEQGLTSMLLSDEVTPDAVIRTTEQDGLRLLTTGPLPPNPAELLASQRMRVVLERLSGEADLIIFDSPPLEAVTDAAILSSYCDGTLLVIDARRSRRRVVRRGREALARAGARVLGAVLNRASAQDRLDYAEYYGGGYGPKATAQAATSDPEASIGASGT